jgi:hypothetical protein
VGVQEVVRPRDDVKGSVLERGVVQRDPHA